ncbi:MAG TPA: polyprenol monophosphomannose synthase [Candidatus Udaeobacter sp.]|jgi:dolichol-phosphate mannosyltransferase|nr:polyprenol monophosphomannose synthase [Candidatus Udaeobacter sp.]
MRIIENSISIIVPTLNEEENIVPLVSEITACAVPFREILFVDDHSTDATRDKIHALAGSWPIRLIEQDGAGPGLAGAIMSGARAAQAEILLVMDADLSHPADRIKDLVAPLFADTADLVVGSRYVKGGSTPGWPVWRRVVSRTGAVLAYPLTGLHDSMCGFFAIGRSRLLELAPQTSGFKIVFETMVRARGTLRVREIPIVFRERVRGKSKMSLGVALGFFLRWLRAIFEHLIHDVSPRERSANLADAAEALHPEAPGE